ncbi:SIS domain-containing protein [bacterium]|nr:SIS domain-containing protein [bacterium]
MQVQKAGVFSEILDQPRAWRETLQMLVKRKDELGGWLKGENFGQIVFVGCASSYCVAVSAAHIAQLVSGLNTEVYPSSEFCYLRRPPYDSRIKTLVVAISRSNDSDDTFWAVDKLKKLHPAVKVLGIFAKDGGRIQAMCDQTVILPNTLEIGPVSTRSASSSLLACMVLTAWISNKDAFINELVRVPDIYGDPNYMKNIQDTMRKLSVPKPLPLHFVFLGCGPYYGLALEAARKLREFVAYNAEAQQTLEFRHGGQGGLTKENMVFCFLSDTMRKAELDVLGGLAKYRCPRIVVLEQSDESVKLRSDQAIELKTKVSEITRILAMYPVIHFLTFYMSIARGKNADKLYHLEPLIQVKDRPGV